VPAILEPFEALRLSTLCPYAARARVAYGSAWDDGESRDANLRRTASAFAAWAAMARENRSHGFVLEVGLSAASDFEQVRRAFGDTLLRLNEHDPAHSSCMRRPIEAAGWQYEFGGLRLFVNVFAPCYPTRHSKHVEAERRFYVFFQPEFSFDLCGVNSANRGAKETVRRIFRDAGCPYDGAVIDRRIEAHLYMFPLDPGDDAVRWWR